MALSSSDLNSPTLPAGNAADAGNLLQRITHAATYMLPASSAVVSLITDDTENVVETRGLTDSKTADIAHREALRMWNASGGADALRSRPSGGGLRRRAGQGGDVRRR